MIAIFWSGRLGGEAARVQHDLLTEVFGSERVFISTEIAPSTRWLPKLEEAIATARVGLFCLTADALESRWLPFECGCFVGRHTLDDVVPVRFGVAQELLDRRLPMLKDIMAIECDSPAAFRKLVRVCAEKVGDGRDRQQLDDASDRAWRAHEARVAAVAAKSPSYLPNSYEGTTRFAMGVRESNFQMPEVFEQFEKDFFLIGINHAFVLNIETDSAVMTALIKRLLGGQGRRARFMISDMWDPGVFACYQNLVTPGYAEAERAAFTRIYKSDNGALSFGSWIASSFGADALERIVKEQLLRIGTLPTILDTLWFVDGKRCQFSLANALSGPYRPYIHCGEGPDEAPRILDYYKNLANTAFGQARPLWPVVAG